MATTQWEYCKLLRFFWPGGSGCELTYMGAITFSDKFAATSLEQAIVGKLGQAGWELVSVDSNSNDKGSSTMYYFKRPAGTPVQQPLIQI